MKNQKIIWSVIAVIVIVVIVIFISRGSGSNSQPAAGSAGGTAAVTGTTSAPVVTAPVGQVASVSAATKKYQNPELGFSVDYPSAWGLQDADSGPTFTIPTNGNTGILTLQSQIYFVSGACEFPAVASSTIVGQSTLVAGDNSYKMLKVSSTAQSKTNLDEMYTFQQGTAPAQGCYVFSFASTAVSPVSTASQTTITAAAKAFTTMVQSFAIVTGPAGQSETAHPNGN